MIFSAVFNAFFPLRCPGCDGINDTKASLCSDCSERMLHPSRKKNRCDICFLSAKECICAKRQYYDKLCVPLYYEGKTRSALHKLKFRGRRDLAKPIAKLITEALRERDMLEKTDYITFIPMRRYDRFVRGYNQAELIAREISAISGIPCEKLLRKTVKTPKQHLLNRTERSGNLLGVFEPEKDKTDIISGKTILVADDIITTGCTANEISKTLLIFGAESVEICACAAPKKIK